MSQNLDSPLERLVDAVMEQPDPTQELQDALKVFVLALCRNEAVGIRDAAATLGKVGGRKGGLARAAKLSPTRRREIAQDAANIRWGNK